MNKCTIVNNIELKPIAIIELLVLLKKRVSRYPLNRASSENPVAKGIDDASKKEKRVKLPGLKIKEPYFNCRVIKDSIIRNMPTPKPIKEFLSISFLENPIELKERFSMASTVINTGANMIRGLKINSSSHSVKLKKYLYIPQRTKMIKKRRSGRLIYLKATNLVFQKG